jgi:hypothetical protein
MVQRIDKYELVEVQIPSGSTATRFFFPDLPKLRGKKVTAINTWNSASNPLTPSGGVLIGPYDMKQSYVTFYTDGRQDLWRIPLLQLHIVSYASGYDIAVRDTAIMEPQTITWEKSYIEVGQAIGGTPCSYMFGVYYS